MAGYHGIRGEFEQCDKLIAELTNRKWVVHPIVYSGKMLGLIRLGQPQEAIQFYEDVTKRTGTNGNKMRSTIHKILVFELNVSSLQSIH
jgi:hypothetical protein